MSQQIQLKVGFGDDDDLFGETSNLLHQHQSIICSSSSSTTSAIHLHHRHLHQQNQ
ncbi:hypothetical protein Hanom_Chr04g00330081 [Helianthus anomalus]